MKDRFQKSSIGRSVPLLFDLIDSPCRPSMNWRVHVAKGPFVSRNLSVGMHVPFSRHQHQLFFSEYWIDQCKGYAVESQIPSRVPWILPLVGHRNNVRVVKVAPFAVATNNSGRWRGWLTRVAFKPLRDIEVVKLLRPNQARDGLPLYVALIFAVDIFLQVSKIVVCFRYAIIKEFMKALERFLNDSIIAEQSKIERL